MKFTCTLQQSESGWIVRHEGELAGTVEVRAASREEALEKMRGELRYRLEICPCTGESYRHIDVQLLEQ